MFAHNAYLTWIVLVGLVGLLDAWCIRWMRRRWMVDEASPHVRVLGDYSPIFCPKASRSWAYATLAS